MALLKTVQIFQAFLMPKTGNKALFCLPKMTLLFRFSFLARSRKEYWQNEKNKERKHTRTILCKQLYIKKFNLK